MLLLRDLGLDPASEEARTAVARVRDNVVWTEWDRRPYFSGEVETCINGMVLALAAYFRELGAGDGRLLGRLLDEQLQDGGWNCLAPDNSRRSSFNTTITVLEGLWEYERAAGPDPAVSAALPRRGVPVGASPVPEAVDRKGRRPGLDAVLLFPRSGTTTS